jgi:hypothetical protein
MTLQGLRKLCVNAFPLSSRRDRLMRSVEALCTTVSTALIVSEIWIDGSFLTQKMDPDDVDLVAVVPALAWPAPICNSTFLSVLPKKTSRRHYHAIGEAAPLRHGKMRPQDLLAAGLEIPP